MRVSQVSTEFGPETETESWREGAATEYVALQRFIEEQAERTPHGIALIDPRNGGGSLTYRQLNRKANQLASYLQLCGAGPDEMVGICMERSIDMIVSVLATIKAGAAYVPFDPAYPAERLEFMLEDTRAPIILTQEKLQERLPKQKTKVICVDRDEALISGQPHKNPPVSSTGENLAYVIYTSGSTGRPKGVAMRQGALVNLMQWQLANFSFNEPTRTLQFASLNFDVSFQEIFSTLASGGSLVLIDDVLRRDARGLLQHISSNKVQRIFLPFVALKHLAEASEYMNITPSDLREVITAGEQLQITPAIVSFFERLPQATLENQYGPSETHVVTAYRMEGAPKQWPPLPSIGKAITNTKCVLLDDQMRAVRDGEVGELYLGGDCLARGYLYRQDLTAAKFIDDPFGPPGSRLYKTGDLARVLADGNIQFLGRIDHQVKINGFRIELGEIEAVLHQHPAIKEAAVIAKAADGGENQLFGYVVPHLDQTISAGELRQFLKSKLPPYMVPARFVRLKALPLNPNGKVDRKALPEGEPMVENIVVEFKPPQTPLQMQLQLVFERFLKKRPIGIDVSFFELGGDSLQALNLIIELERVTGKTLPLGILYEAPTIDALSKAIERHTDTKWSSLVPLQPLGKKAPLFFVHTTPGDVLGYGALVYQLGLEQPCYGFQSLGFYDPQQAHQRVEEMAAYYVKLLREFQSHGPYYLSGWCYGGIIAVEMAHQLRAAGEEVAFLGLIETPAPPPETDTLRFYLRRVDCLLEMNPIHWFRYLRAKVKYYSGVKEANEQRFKRVEKADPKEGSLEEINKHLERLEHVYGVNDRALKYYRSKRYPGKVTLFNAAQQDPALIRDPMYGWRGLAKDIEAYVIAGDHDTILAEPQAKQLARKMTECIARAATETANLQSRRAES
jgi:amino acid adenylation domain-containing protein